MAADAAIRNRLSKRAVTLEQFGRKLENGHNIVVVHPRRPAGEGTHVVIYVVAIERLLDGSANGVPPNVLSVCIEPEDGKWAPSRRVSASDFR